jgi:hypothetical protein
VNLPAPPTAVNERHIAERLWCPIVLPIPERLIPLAAHLCVEGYSDRSRADILDYTQGHGQLPPPDWFDGIEDYDRARDIYDPTCDGQRDFMADPQGACE